MIKVDVISGFLGAGKTTLIKKLFERGFKNERVVIIENEFGEIGIDSSFLKETGINIKEINAGCICCSLVGDFSASLKELIHEYHPDRIIIEPSGVGKLSDIIDAIKNIKSEELKLNILVTVVDGPRTKMQLKNFGEFFLNQIEAANSIVLNKVEKLSHEQIDSICSTIKEHNQTANIMVTPFNDFDSLALLAILETSVSLQDKLMDEVLNEHHHEGCHCHEHEEHHHHDGCCCHEHEEHHHHEGCCCHEHEDHHHHDGCCCHEHEDHHHHEGCCCHEHEEHHHHEGCRCHEHEEHHHHHHADEVFTSIGKETSRSLSEVQLKSFLSALDDKTLGLVVRCKGVLKDSNSDNWFYFDYVPGEYEIRIGSPDYNGRFVIIGSNLNENKIEELFNNL